MLTGAGLTDLQDMMVSLSARWWRGSAVTGEAPCEGARHDPDAQPARAWAARVHFPKGMIDLTFRKK